MAGLFGDNFNPNLGWLSGVAAPPPNSGDMSLLDKIGLLFTDPFGKSVPFSGGVSSGPDNSRLGLLFSDPFGARVPFAGALAKPDPATAPPSTNPADYAGLASAFGIPSTPQVPSVSPAPPAVQPQAKPPVVPGPTLDQRAYGSPTTPAPQMPPQAANAMAQAAPQPAAQPDFLTTLSNFSHNLGSAPGLPGIIDAIRGIQTGQRYDAAGQKQQNQMVQAQAIFQSLTARGYPQQVAMGMAQAAVSDPKIAEKILGDAYAIPKTAEEFAVRQASTGGQTSGNPFDILRQKNAAEKAGTTEGERVANAQLDLPTAVAQAQEQLRLVNELRNHPGRNQIGWHDVLGGVPLVPSTKGYDAQKLLDSIKGGAFLEAFKTLKGGGQITEIEGKKATDAIARMDRATSRAEFDRALSDYEGVIRLGVDRANQLAGKPAPNNFQGNSAWQNVAPGVRIRQVQ